jgi:hypothetical protein
MGQCYENWRQNRKIYEQVVREFADQASAVTKRAKGQLNRGATRNAVLTARQIWLSQDTAAVF